MSYTYAKLNFVRVHVCVRPRHTHTATVNEPQRQGNQDDLCSVFQRFSQFQQQRQQQWPQVASIIISKVELLVKCLPSGNCTKKKHYCVSTKHSVLVQRAHSVANVSRLAIEKSSQRF